MGSADQTMLATVGHWIDGQEQPARADARRADVFDPATGSIARQVALADAAEVRTLLLEIDDILHRRPQMGSLLVEVDRLRQQVRGLAMGSQDGWAATLTTAELRLLPLLASHWSFREIGDQMFLSRNTIKTQAISIYRKLGVSSRTQALEKAAELGLLSELSPLTARPGELRR